MRAGQFFLSLCAAVLLAGCVEGMPDTRPPEMTFANLQPLQMDVSTIEIRNDYHPPMQAPNIEHTFPTTPYAAAEKLVKKQLVAAGANDRVLRVVIEDASVVREELPVTDGILGEFTREPAERLKAKVLLRFEMYDRSAPDITIGHAEVIAKRGKTLVEDITIAERDRAYFSLTEDLMDDVNDGLRSIVKNTFGKR